ncbi:MAG: hypothetical protein ACOCV1_04285 [Bacillota bacterium]
MSNLRITDNDLKLFRYLFEQDFLTREQIKNYVWKDLNNSHIDNRLARLTKLNYIKKHPDLSGTFTTVVMADKMAKTLLSNNTIVERMINLEDYFINDKTFINSYITREKPSLGRFNHDEYLTNIRFKLEKSVSEFMSYRLLQVYNKNNSDNKYTRPTPDSLAVVNGKTIAIELENTPKRRIRYEKDIFSGYNEDDRIDYVLYFCTDRNIYEKIIEYVAKYFSKNPINTEILAVDYEKVMKHNTILAVRKDKKGEIKTKKQLR